MHKGGGEKAHVLGRAAVGGSWLAWQQEEGRRRMVGFSTYHAAEGAAGTSHAGRRRMSWMVPPPLMHEAPMRKKAWSPVLSASWMSRRMNRRTVPARLAFLPNAGSVPSNQNPAPPLPTITTTKQVPVPVPSPAFLPSSHNHPEMLELSQPWMPMFWGWWWCSSVVYRWVGKGNASIK